MVEAKFEDDPLTTWDIKYCNLHATTSKNYAQTNSKIVKEMYEISSGSTMKIL